MSDDKLQKGHSAVIKDKAQYLLALGVIVSMLWVVNFPPYVIFFFGIFIYFSIKLFTGRSNSDARDIFEFYLSSNEILRDDERRWFGFEIYDVISRGERILNRMPGAPPLMHFSIGALYNKIGDHMTAVQHLAIAVENEQADESKNLKPTPELRNYVRILRKIERDPAEAPLTSGAVRALERARRNRGSILLKQSRELAKSMTGVEHIERQAETDQRRIESFADVLPNVYDIDSAKPRSITDTGSPIKQKRRPRTREEMDDAFANRQPITDVLHDIYDRNTSN